VTTLRGPNQVAEGIEGAIADIKRCLAEGVPRTERKQLNKSLHLNRQLLAWCKSRAGYSR
jgi:hypothetical protein